MVVVVEVVVELLFSATQLFFFFLSSYTSTSQGGVIIPERAAALFLSWGSEKSCCQCLSKVWHGGGPRLWASPQSAVITLGPAAAVSRCASLHAYIQQRHPLFFSFFSEETRSWPCCCLTEKKRNAGPEVKGALCRFGEVMQIHNFTKYNDTEGIYQTQTYLFFS